MVGLSAADYQTPRFIGTKLPCGWLISHTDQNISACVRWNPDLPIEEETDTNQPTFDWSFWNVKLKQPHLSLRHWDWHVLWLIGSAAPWTFNHRNIRKGQRILSQSRAEY